MISLTLANALLVFVIITVIAGMSVVLKGGNDTDRNDMDDEGPSE